MSTEKFSFWSIIGKVAGLMSLLWISVQLYNYFFNKDFKIIAQGNEAPFYLPHDISLKVKESFEWTAFRDYLSISNQKLSPEIIKPIEKSIKKINGDYYSSEKATFELALKYLTENSQSVTRKYARIWWFTVRNDGNNIVEDLVLELPFSGFFSATGKTIKKAETFDNRIELGSLSPTHSIVIYAWQDGDVFESFYIDSHKEQSRFTHKNGWQNITYPAQVTGLVAWNKENNNTPLYLGVLVLIISYIVAFFLGEKYGPKIREIDKKQKLEDFKKLKELEKEEASSQKLIDDGSETKTEK